MFNRIKSFFTQPQFEEDEQRRALVLNGLSISIGIASLVGAVGVFTVFEEKLISGIALGILFASAFVSLSLSKTRHVHSASILLLTTLWVLVTGLVSISGGMRSLDIIFYLTVTALAGLLLGQRGIYIYSAVTVVAGIVFLILENTGISLPVLFPFPAPTGLVLLLINFVVLVPAINITINTLSKTVEQSQHQLEEQRQIQEELRVSEEKFSKVFHASPMAILLQRRSDRKYTDVNEEFTRITGYSQEEALGHGPRDLNLYPDKEIAKKIAEQIAEQEYIRDFEFPFRRKSGEIGYGLLWGDRLEINNEFVNIGGVIDITDRKQYEMLQAEQAQEITALYESLTEITGASGNIEGLSQQIADIIVSKLQAYKCAVWLLSEDRSKLTRTAHSGPDIIEGLDDIPLNGSCLITYAIEHGENIYVPDVRDEPRYCVQDEKTNSEFVVPLQAHGETIGVINMESPNLDGFNERTRRLVVAFSENAALVLQNTKLVDSLEATIADLKETQDRISFFLEHTAEGIYRLDYDPPIPTHLPYEEQFKLSIERGKIGECNDAIARMYGYQSREEMLGTLYIELYGEEGYEANLDTNLEFYHQGYKVDDVETEEYTLSGEKVYFLNNVVGIIRDDHFVATWGTQRDITPLKHAIAELEKRNAELERFAYTLSHELKTPLVTMRGFLGYLEEAMMTGKVEQAKSDLARISKATDKMHNLIKELLELSRIGILMNPPEDVPFEEVVQEALEQLENQLSESRVKVEVDPDLPVVHGDRLRLVEAVQNLVDNAVKYMGDQPEPHIEIGIREENESAGPVFFVKDNGLGIDPAYHKKVFGLFDKLDPQSKGTGIGLALVKRIIETHGGRIWVESDGRWHGSCFCFTLPTAA